MPRKRYQPIELEQEVKRLAGEEHSPSQIKGYLEDQERFKGKVPSLRTLQRLVKEIVPPDLSGEWSLADADPEDARLVLDSLADLTELTGGRGVLTRVAAEWVLKVRRAAPSLPGLDALSLAREYRVRVELRESTRDLDLFLALTPWESTDAARRYRAMMAAGVTLYQPLYLGYWQPDVVHEMMKKVRSPWTSFTGVITWPEGVVGEMMKGEPKL